MSYRILWVLVEKGKYVYHGRYILASSCEYGSRFGWKVIILYTKYI